MNLTTIIILVIIGLMAGVFGGMFGVGGAIIMIPALVYFLGVEPDSRLFPHQIVGRGAARPGGDAVFRLHDGRLGGPAGGLSGRLSIHR